MQILSGVLRNISQRFTAYCHAPFVDLQIRNGGGYSTNPNPAQTRNSPDGQALYTDIGTNSHVRVPSIVIFVRYHYLHVRLLPMHAVFVVSRRVLLVRTDSDLWTSRKMTTHSTKTGGFYSCWEDIFSEDALFLRNSNRFVWHISTALLGDHRHLHSPRAYPGPRQNF